MCFCLLPIPKIFVHHEMFSHLVLVVHPALPDAVEVFAVLFFDFFFTHHCAVHFLKLCELVLHLPHQLFNRITILERSSLFTTHDLTHLAAPPTVTTRRATPPRPRCPRRVSGSTLRSLDVRGPCSIPRMASSYSSPSTMPPYTASQSFLP